MSTGNTIVYGCWRRMRETVDKLISTGIYLRSLELNLL